MVIRISILTFIFLSFSLSSSLQETIPDTLLDKLTHADDKTKISVYNLISRDFTLNSPEKKIEYAKKALSLAIELNITDEQYHAYMNLATGYYFQGKNMDALDADLMALETASEIGDKNFMARAHNSVGVDYLSMDSYEKSLDHFLKSVELKKEIIKETDDKKTEKGLAVTYNNIGSIYLDLQYYNKAEEYFTRSLDINTKYNDSASISRNLHNLGSMHEKQKEYRKALEYFLKSLEIRRKSGDKREIALTLYNIGIVHSSLNQNSEALACYQESMNLFTESNYASGISFSALSIGNILLKTQKPAQAYTYLNEALELAQQNGLKKQESVCYESLSRYYANINRFDEAYRTLLLRMETKDSLFNESMTEKIASIELRAETESREKEIMLQKAELQKKDAVLQQKTFQRNAIAAGLFFAIALITFIFLAYRRQQKSHALLSAHKEKIEKQNQELSVLNATKDKFFNIIAHDLKNPFNAIMGLSDLLVQNYSTLNDELKMELIKSISTSSHETFKLLENLLEWSRSQSGYMKFVPESTHLKPYFGELYNLFYPLSRMKKINLEMIVDETIHVNVDKNMLNTIIRNLVSNAIKYSFPNGKISVQVSVKDSLVYVSVIDQGTGMSPHNVNRLFRIDDQFMTLGTQKEKGTGLGLILCKELVEKHGGTIFASSTEGKGSTFTFTLPSS